jgi:SPP1 gp7 family putative phage head morphogenesis protein
VPTIYDIAEEQRRALLASERAAAAEMVRAYGLAWKRMRQDLDALLKQIEDARKAGLVPDQFTPRAPGGPPIPRTPGTFSPSWLFRQERYQSLLRQVEAEMAQFSALATGTITAQQELVTGVAQDQAEQLALAGLGEGPAGVTITWDRLPKDAFTDLVGFLQNGSPLKDLLDELGPAASRSIQDELIQAVALGQNPRVTARRIRGALGDNMVRALRISRTETMRAYREATRRSYQANANVVNGWYWTAALDGRTCAACWAMSGTFHTNDERLDDHVNGRCAMVPKTKTWAELGFTGIDETAPKPRIGVDEFDKLTPEQQARVLGKAGLEAYQALKVDLRDFVGQRNSPRWGTMRYARSLKRALAESGMPTVTHEGAGAQPIEDVRYAIRMLRDRVGSLRGVNITVSRMSVHDILPNGTVPWGEIDQAHTITLYNNVAAWRADSDLVRRDHEGEGRIARVAGSARERLAETLVHEYAHLRTLQRAGWYPDPHIGWGSAPATLVDRARLTLTRDNLASSDYNVGEVIAEDFRWAFFGREARMNRYTFWGDIPDEGWAWQRAQEVLAWLTT